MPAISPSRALHWHKEGRQKTCVMCRETKELSAFYAYEYTTRQGKRSTRYESRCVTCSRERRKESYHANSVAENERMRRWRTQNAARRSEYNRERQSREDVRALKALHQRMRKAKTRSGSGSTQEIKAIYQEAMRIEGIVALCPLFKLPELGCKMHVDHIIPLARGGKHVAENLQILPAGINLRKGAHA